MRTQALGQALSHSKISRLPHILNPQLKVLNYLEHTEFATSTEPPQSVFNNEIINEAKSYLKFEKEKDELEKIVNDKNNDKEMILLAKNELELLTKNHNENEKKLKLFLLPKDEADTKNAIYYVY